MINYVWLGLIVIAILFGGYMSFLGPEIKETPDPTVLEDFEGEATAVPSLPLDSEVYYEAENEEQQGQSAVVSYDFEETDRVDIPVDASFERDVMRPRWEGSEKEVEIAADAVTVAVYGDNSGHLLRARFEDVDGQEFGAEGSPKINWDVEEGDRWQQVRFELDDLTPLSNNPGATPDYPLTWTGLSLVESQASEVQSGTIHIDHLQVSYPTRTVVKEEVESERWMGVLTKSAARWAETSINLAISLIGIMMLWLGMMRIAEKAGLVQLLAKALKPILTRLFPKLPPEGEAMGAIVMNVAANMLGLGNAATPLGLKAMEELQKVNENKEYASNAMAMLLALNTSSVTLLPATVIGFRAAAGSQDILKFWPLMICSTLFSTICAVAACKFLEKLPAFRVPPPSEQETADEGGEA